MLLSSGLVLFCGLLCGASNSSSSSTDPVPTYQYQDPVTGELLLCNKCPPGTHREAHCTSSEQTRCVACENNHYTKTWNYLPRCLYCDNFCTDDQEVERECSAKSNRLCRCKQGFYLIEDFCMELTKCGPGHGVLVPGTPQTNTVCEICDAGFFSNSSSTLDPCLRHRECPSGHVVLLPGSEYHDTVCGTCQDLTDGGATSRPLLSGIFYMHKMRVSRLRKFVAKHIHKSGVDRHARSVALHKQRGPLLDEITAWLAVAPEDQLRNLPKMLRDTHLSSLAEKLESRISENKKLASNCSAAPS